MAASSSSSSYTSSSATRPSLTSNSQTFSSPAGSNWTPISTFSDSTHGSGTPQGLPAPLDLGPPGFQATITLFENTANERTVYLGPWEVVGSDQRRIFWQCSYQMERLEHFLPSPTPSDIIPHTLHARHRQFADPFQLEQYVMFREPHRIRYTNEDGVVILDQPIEIKYEFTTIESSFRFQGDLRRKDLVDCFDVDVIWTDTQGRTDSFGSVRGIGTVQRLKVWTDQYSSAHSLTIFANRSKGRYREYHVDRFEGEVGARDDRRRTLRLVARGRRGSAPEGRRRSFSSAFRPRQRSVGVTSTSSPLASNSSGALGIRYLGIQFSRDEDYRRFLDTWIMAHSSDNEFRGTTHPHERFELPSPEMLPGVSYELPASEIYHTEMQSVPEGHETNEEDIGL